MKYRSTLAILTLALLTAPAFAGGVAATIDDPQSAWHPAAAFTSVDAHASPAGSPTDFGTSVAVDSGTAIVGAPYNQAVHVYEDDDGVWRSKGVLSGPDGFGRTLDIDGDRIAVGAPSASSLSVFEIGEDGSRRVLDATLTAAGSACLGDSVTLQGDLLAAGDPCGTPSVHTFEYDGSRWVSLGELVVSGDDRFGGSLDLSQGTLLVGGASAYAFDVAESGWSEPMLVATQAGREVALSGDRAATGAVGEARLFERDGDAWSQTATVEPTDASPFELRDRFSFTLDLSGDTLAVGASEDDVAPGLVDVSEAADSECQWAYVAGVCAPQQPGAVYVFQKSGEGWEQVAKFSPEASSGEDFGASVAVDAAAGMILAGAPGHPHTARGFVDSHDAAYAYTRATGEVSP